MTDASYFSNLQEVEYMKFFTLSGISEIPEDTRE